jgi:hypothetical protein
MGPAFPSCASSIDEAATRGQARNMTGCKIIRAENQSGKYCPRENCYFQILNVKDLIFMRNSKFLLLARFLLCSSAWRIWIQEAGQYGLAA